MPFVAVEIVCQKISIPVQNCLGKRFPSWPPLRLRPSRHPRKTLTDIIRKPSGVGIVETDKKAQEFLMFGSNLDEHTGFHMLKENKRVFLPIRLAAIVTKVPIVIG